MASTYRFFTPPRPSAATGLTAAVYAQLTTDFIGPVPTFAALSAAPDLLAATWALMREALLAGPAPRLDREVVATAVSRANRCRFCVDAHVMLLHSLGEHDLAETLARGDDPTDPRLATLIAWATATRTPRASACTGGYPAEYVGTALAFHFINRVVSALLGDNLLPGGLQRSPIVRNLGGRAFAGRSRLVREPGRSLDLLAGIPAGTPPQWAARSPVGTAYAALRSAATRCGDLLSSRAMDLVEDAVAELDGAHLDQAADWAAYQVWALPVAQQPAARIALLTAIAPAAITAEDVAELRAYHPGDESLVRVVAYGAMAAVSHVECHVVKEPTCSPR